MTDDKRQPLRHEMAAEMDRVSKGTIPFPLGSRRVKREHQNKAAKPPATKQTSPYSGAGAKVNPDPKAHPFYEVRRSVRTLLRPAFASAAECVRQGDKSGAMRALSGGMEQAVRVVIGPDVHDSTAGFFSAIVSGDEAEAIRIATAFEDASKVEQ